MISADIKANKNNKKKTSYGCILQIFINLKYNVKRAWIFHLFDFAWYYIHLNIVR